MFFARIDEISRICVRKGDICFNYNIQLVLKLTNTFHREQLLDIIFRKQDLRNCVKLSSSLCFVSISTLSENSCLRDN